MVKIAHIALIGCLILLIDVNGIHGGVSKISKRCRDGHCSEDQSSNNNNSGGGTGENNDGQGGSNREGDNNGQESSDRKSEDPNSSSNGEESCEEEGSQGREGPHKSRVTTLGGPKGECEVARCRVSYVASAWNILIFNVEPSVAVNLIKLRDGLLTTEQGKEKTIDRIRSYLVNLASNEERERGRRELREVLKGLLTEVCHQSRIRVTSELEEVSKGRSSSEKEILHKLLEGSSSDKFECSIEVDVYVEVTIEFLEGFTFRKDVEVAKGNEEQMLAKYGSIIEKASEKGKEESEEKGQKQGGEEQEKGSSEENKQESEEKEGKGESKEQGGRGESEEEENQKSIEEEKKKRHGGHKARHGSPHKARHNGHHARHGSHNGHQARHESHKARHGSPHKARHNGHHARHGSHNGHQARHGSHNNHQARHGSHNGHQARHGANENSHQAHHN